MSQESQLKVVYNQDWDRVFSTGYVLYERVLYFGNWETVYEDGPNYHCYRCSNTQHNAFEFSFKGPVVQWIGSKRSNHGFADIYIDGEFQQTVDNFSAVAETDVLKFEKRGLSENRLHTLRVEVRKERNPEATDCYQEVTFLKAVTPVSYEAEINESMCREYEQIQNGTKQFLPPDTWNPVKNRADVPSDGVELKPGLLHSAFKRNIDYLNHCFSSPTYCDGEGWSRWLPASNEGRLLAGAAGTLRWEERQDMRAIVEAIVDNIEKRMREDGYYNYYDESDSYALKEGTNSERKNYDRVFWTRGLLAAGLAGTNNAYGILRRMYDWFNDSQYLPWMLLGGNATNGLPGGPLMYLSPAGTENDLLTTERYYDQDYWMNELANREPLSLSHYPGERPHCYDLLGLEAFVDEYRATGAEKYLDAVLGGWDIYKENYMHVGGATAIMESEDRFPPKSYRFAGPHWKYIGETCGSVFWININSKLLQLYPDQEKYAAEIEEALYNVMLANQDERGYIRYHSYLEGTKKEARCENTCCEVSSAGLYARLPELIYSVAPNGVFVNLYSASSIAWKQGNDPVTLSAETDFPFSPEVLLKISTTTQSPVNIRVRIPSWANANMVVKVNGEDFGAGEPGSYLSIQRVWSNNETISFSLPMGFTTIKYTGLDQIEGNYDRYALMYGPILMALRGELTGPGGVPHLAADPVDIPSLMKPTQDRSMEYSIDGYPDYTYVPYWKIDEGTYTCYPIMQKGG